MRLSGDIGGVWEALVQSRLIPSDLHLGAHVAGIEQLIVLSSEALVELRLNGAWLIFVDFGEEKR